MISLIIDNIDIDISTTLFTWLVPLRLQPLSLSMAADRACGFHTRAYYVLMLRECLRWVCVSELHHVTLADASLYQKVSVFIEIGDRFP